MAYISTMCPKYSEKLLHGHFFQTKSINKLVVFHCYWDIGCQQNSYQKQWYHPVPRASGSVLFFSQTGLWQLHACTLAEVKAVTSEGTVKSQPALHDVGVLPTITQMFPISWASPILLTHFWHYLNLECYHQLLKTLYEKWMRKSD